MYVKIGTGDVAFRTLNALSSNYESELLIRNIRTENVADSTRQVVVCDINPQMLAVGRDRADKILKGAQRNMVGF
jgi:ubiquinone/menaquinone biosynthesis C-methylase UbiE